MTFAEKQSLMRLSDTELKRRIDLAECVILDGIKELAGESAIKEVIRQKEVIIRALKDKRTLRTRKKKPEGVIVGLKTLNLFMRKG
jgi:uncharacterized protein YtpQ (UPF0354 family)